MGWDRGLPTQQEALAGSRAQEQRAAGMTATQRLLHLQHLAGNRSASVVAQRAIVQGTWDTEIDPYLSSTMFAEVTEDGSGTKKHVRKKAGNLEVRTAQTAWAPVGGLPAFLAAHTWTKVLVNSTGGKADRISFATPGSLTSNIDAAASEVNMDVQDIPGDRHSLVHHSYSTYKTTPKRKGATAVRREAGHHLTVENAHLLLLMSIEGDKTGAFLDKTALDKPGVNRELTGRGANELDNINFFPTKGAQQARDLGKTPDEIPTTKLPEAEDPATENVDQSLSLRDYLAFIQRALARLPGVSPAYGAKILHTAREMQRLTGLDPAQLFLKIGKGDQRQVVRAVMTIAHRNLAPGLAVPQATMEVFQRYVTSTGDLPLKEPVDQATEWVPKGALASDRTTRYNDLEARYVDAHYATIIQALKTFIA